MYLRRVAIAAVLVGCGDDAVQTEPGTSSESSSSGGSDSAPPTSSSTDGSSSTGTAVDDSSSGSDTGASSESTGGEASATLRTVLVDDLDGDGQWWAYMVEWSGDEVGAPVRVHGPTAQDSSVDVVAVSSELLAVSTTAEGGARTWELVELGDGMVGASGPLVLAPAPLASAPSVQFFAEDARVVFSAAELVDGPRSLWSTSYDGAVAQAPERLSPVAPEASYGTFVLAPAHDAVLAARTEADGPANLVWMPHAPADPEAAIVLTAHTESWQTTSQYGFAADGESVHYLASTSEDHDQLFVDDLDDGTPAVPVHPALAAEHTVRSLAIAPDRAAFAYWVGSYDPPTPARGDVYVAAVDGTSVGTPVDVDGGDAIATTSDISWSPDSRWLVYMLWGDQPRKWIARIDGSEVARYMLPDSSIGDAAFDPDAHFLYYVADNERLLRVDVIADVPGAPELVSETPAAGGVHVTSDLSALTFVGNDPGGNWAAYLLDTARLPAFTVRVDPAPQVGARLSPSALLTRDEQFLMTHEFIDNGVPALVHATALADPYVTATLGTSVDGTYETLPEPH